jgi:protein phosphatase
VTLVARHAALTDIGLHRTTNEDAYVAEPPLFAVCDGMGGASAGEVASRIAAGTLVSESAGDGDLLAAARAANTAVFAQANERIDQTGMGTTLTALRLEGERGHIVHIGDSRAYLLRDGELRQLTDDHSLVGELLREGRITADEAATHPHRSVLSRALGTEPSARIDESDVELQAGDSLLLCSDGLSGVVDETRIRELLGRRDPADAARKLVAAARKAGGPDNITAVLLRVASHKLLDDDLAV